MVYRLQQKNKTNAWTMAMAKELCIRDQIIIGFLELQITMKQICNMQLYDVATVPREPGGFIEAQPVIGVCGDTFIVPMALRSLIEDYVNVSLPVRPFRDYRPDIGHHLFPSAVSTGKGLSSQAISKIIQRNIQQLNVKKPVTETKCIGSD
jgi:hypothetical protein